MKILGIVLAVLMLSLSALVGALGANKSLKLADDLAQVTAGMSGADKASLDLPSEGRLKAGGAVSALGALGALALIVLTFVKRPLVRVVGAATVALCAAAIVIYPSVPTGPMDGMAPRTQAIVAAVMALVGAAGAFLAERASAGRRHGAAAAGSPA